MWVHRKSIRPLAAIIFVFLATSSAKSQNRKLVIAHYMTDMVPQTNRPLIRWTDPELADPSGSTASLGGISQTVPMASVHLQDADLASAVDFEIRAARQLGIDGFQFYYPLGDDTAFLRARYNEILREFFRVSDARYPGFKITLCLAHPSTSRKTTEAERIALWSVPIQELIRDTKESSAWLRAPSGQRLFYLWVGDALADGIVGVANTPRQIRDVGLAYQRLSEAIGTPIQYVYQVRRTETDSAYIDAIVETFSAVWGWTSSEENTSFWDALAERCAETDCTYTQTVYPDYYTSKLYRKDAGYSILSTSEALKVGLAGGERHYRVTNLSGTQVKLLNRALKHDVSIINYVTWNDFPEGHHLAPEQCHNFGPSLLLRHFKRQWREGKAEVNRDVGIVFCKKYRHDRLPKHSAELKIKSQNKNVASEDRIELVTMLTDAAACFLNGHALGTAPSGFQVHSIPTETGPISVRIVRQGREVLSFETPFSITDAPLRTDRLTYSYSSEYDREFRRLFPSGQ